VGYWNTTDSAGLTLEGVAFEQAPLRYFVIDSAGQNTAATIREAGALASGLHAEMTLLAAIEVPLPLQLDEPHVSIPFQENRLRELVVDSGLGGRVELLLCRDRCEAIRRALPAGSVVFLGGRKGKLAALLVRDRHRVFFVGEGGNS